MATPGSQMTAASRSTASSDLGLWGRVKDTLTGRYLIIEVCQGTYAVVEREAEAPLDPDRAAYSGPYHHPADAQRGCEALNRYFRA